MRVKRCTANGLVLILSLSAWLLPACNSCEESGDVEMQVHGVMIDPSSRAPVVVLEDRASGAELPIWIGPAEARAIAMTLEGVGSPRPMTHDLVKSVLDRAGVRFDRILIHALLDGTYHATIFLRTRGDAFEIDSRPSDAIALALRFEKPIFVARQLIERSARAAFGPGGAETLTVEGVTVQAISQDLAEHFEIEPGHGVLVAAIAAQTTSELHPGDVILEIDGKVVRAPAEFAAMVRGAAGELDLEVQRRGMRIHVPLGPVRR